VVGLGRVHGLPGMTGLKPGGYRLTLKIFLFLCDLVDRVAHFGQLLYVACGKDHAGG